MAVDVVLHLSIDNNRDLQITFQKLHHLLTCAGHRCPFRFCVRILFQPAKIVPVKLKIDLFQSTLRGQLDGILLAVDCRRSQRIWSRQGGLTPR